MEEKFEKALRLKVRFNSGSGVLSIEDLWDLPLTSVNKTSLDGIAIAVNRLLKDKLDESFVATKKPDTEILELKLEILKHIIQVKTQENEAKVNEKIKAEQRAKIQEVIAKKQDSALEGLSIEELQALLKA